MKTLKSILNSVAIGISIGLFLSVLVYDLFGKGGFNLVNPFTITDSYPAYNATLSMLFYGLCGVFVWTSKWLFENDKFGLKKENIIHLFLSLIVFSFFSFLTSASIDNSMGLSYYKNMSLSSWISKLILPVIIIVIGYALTWIIMWLMYLKEISKLNKKIGS